jgi:hypothetical protein
LFGGEARRPQVFTPRADTSKVTLDPDLLSLMDPDSALSSRDDAEPLEDGNDHHGFPAPDPQAESHPELRANVHFKRLSDPQAASPGRRFPLLPLRGRKR